LIPSNYEVNVTAIATVVVENAAGRLDAIDAAVETLLDDTGLEAESVRIVRTLDTPEALSSAKSRTAIAVLCD